MSKEKIRVTATLPALIRIPSNKFLLVRSRSEYSKGRIRYCPLGGYIKYHGSSRDFLRNELGAQLELKGRRFPNTDDCRFFIKKGSFLRFQDWVVAGRGMDQNPGREIYDELVKGREDTGFLEDLPLSAVYFSYAGTTLFPTKRVDLHGALVDSFRFSRVYVTIFIQQFEELIKDELERQRKMKEPTLISVTENEIKQLKTASNRPCYQKNLKFLDTTKALIETNFIDTPI